MKIEVLGSGCPTCKRFYEGVLRAVADLGIDATVDYSTDVQRIVALGIMQSPALTIDGVPVVVGMVPKQEKLKEIIAEHLP